MVSGDNLLNEAFVGATVTTKKVFLIRAILESVVFQVYHLHLLFRNEVYFDKRSPIRYIFLQIIKTIIK